MFIDAVLGANSPKCVRPGIDRGFVEQPSRSCVSVGGGKWSCVRGNNGVSRK